MGEAHRHDQVAFFGIKGVSTRIFIWITSAAYADAVIDVEDKKSNYLLSKSTRSCVQ